MTDTAHASDRWQAAPAIFVGREAELARLQEGLSSFSSAVILGVGGIGKSALAYAFARRWTGRRVVYGQARDADLEPLVDDLRRSLAGGPVDELGALEAKLASLARLLNATSTLLVLDDLHRVGEDAQAQLLRQLVPLLHEGRVLATSRQALPASVELPDHVELRLGELDEASARALWAAMDGLYGPSPSFEIAWQRARGLPLLLRRAHRGHVDADDPLADTIRALSDDEWTIAGALALASLPLPAESLLALPPPDRGSESLRGLVARMIVQIDASGLCSMHDLLRERVLKALDAERRGRLHGELAKLIDGLELDPPIRVREVCRHLRAAECHEDAARFLVDHSQELVRFGAASDLVKGLEAIPLALRTPETRMALARALIHVLDLPRAYQEHRLLVDATPEPPPDLLTSLAQVALMTGQLDVAALVARKGMQAAREPKDVARAATTLALVLAHQGATDEALGVLDAMSAQTEDPVQQAYLASYRAYCLWIADREQEALECAPRARFVLEGEVPSYRAALTPSVFGVLMARAGDFAAAERLFSRADNVLDRRGDTLARLETGGSRAFLEIERGDRLAAIRRLEDTLAGFERCGYLLGALAIKAWLGCVLLTMGRRREGVQLVEAAAAEARRRGIPSVLRVTERALRSDPLAQLESSAQVAPPRARRGEWIRARVLDALRAASAGDARQVALLLEEDGPPDEAGFALDRALGHLARAVVAQIDGRPDAASAALERAQREAASEHVDTDLLPALLHQLGDTLVVTETAKRLVPAGAVDLSPFAVVLDARAHELRCGGQAVSLRKRSVVRRMLYALARRSGGLLSKDELALATWSQAYNPLIHDNSLKSNIRHVRSVARGTGIAIEFDEPGYRLIAPEGFAFVEPFALG